MKNILKKWECSMPLALNRNFDKEKWIAEIQKYKVDLDKMVKS